MTLPEHLHNLCVLLALLLEGEFSLLIVVFVLSTSSVLASLSLVLRHLVGLSKVLVHGVRNGLHSIPCVRTAKWVDNRKGCLGCGEMQEEGVAASDRRRVCVGGVLLCLWAFTAGRIPRAKE